MDETMEAPPTRDDFERVQLQFVRPEQEKHPQLDLLSELVLENFGKAAADHLGSVLEEIVANDCGSERPDPRMLVRAEMRCREELKRMQIDFVPLCYYEVQCAPGTSIVVGGRPVFMALRPGAAC